MSKDKDADFLKNYKVDTIYINDQPAQGKYVNLKVQDVSPQIQLVLQAFYVDKKDDIQSFKLIKLKNDVEENSMVLSGMTFEKVTEFLSALTKLDLKQTCSSRYNLITETDLTDLKQIVENNPNIQDIYAIARKREALAQFEAYLADSSTSEADWQNFFEENSWIFGHGLNYIFVDPVGKALEQVTTGSDFNRPGKRTDSLMKTRAEISQYVLVEIKKESTNLLDTKPYRSGCYNPSKELTGGVAQIQKTCFDFMHNRFKDELKDDQGNLTGMEVFAIKPKTYLIIGNLGQLVGNHDKLVSFELYRQSFNNPEIITFDELYERAKCIVSNIDDKD